MASAGYTRWVNAGKPYRLSQPARDVQTNLRSHGFTVYDYPNDDHLTASKPEDHTPFSVTGWPSTNAFGIAHAIDIMPRKDNMLELARLAKQIIADKDRKVPGTEWIKYINWTDEQNQTFHTSWQPNKSTRSSSDRWHIHISARSDTDNVRATSYDPFIRMTQGGDDMPLTQAEKDEIVYRTATIVLAGIQPAGHAELTAPEPYKGQLQMAVKFTNQALAKLMGQGITDDQVTVLADRIGDKLVASSDNGLTESDKAVVVAAVKQALQEGVD